MLDHIMKARSSSRGETIEGIRMYELTSELPLLRYVRAVRPVP